MSQVKEGIPNVILPCKCDNPKFDKKYGKGMRPHSSARITNKGMKMCISCLTERFPPKERD